MNEWAKFGINNYLNESYRKTTKGQNQAANWQTFSVVVGVAELAKAISLDDEVCELRILEKR